MMKFKTTVLGIIEGETREEIGKKYWARLKEECEKQGTPWLVSPEQEVWQPHFESGLIQ